MLQYLHLQRARVSTQQGSVLAALQSYNNFLKKLINYKKFYKKSFYLESFDRLYLGNFPDYEK